ncbi:hypothetical protein [Clostridium sp. DL1XJH146]
MYELSLNENDLSFKSLEKKQTCIKTIMGHMSINMVESILRNVTDVSYQKTPNNIELMCNQNISHTAVWHVVQKFREKLNEKEQR